MDKAVAEKDAKTLKTLNTSLPAIVVNSMKAQAAKKNMSISEVWEQAARDYLAKEGEPIPVEVQIPLNFNNR